MTINEEKIQMESSWSSHNIGSRIQDPAKLDLLPFLRFTIKVTEWISANMLQMIQLYFDPMLAKSMHGETTNCTQKGKHTPRGMQRSMLHAQSISMV